MKKIYFNLTSFALAGISIAFAACTNEPAALIEQAESNAPIIYASQELQAKSSITVDGEGVGTIYWSPADNISIFYGASTPVLYTSTNLAPETTAAFTTSAIIGSTELASTNIWGLYPHNPSAVCDGSSISTTLPSTQYGVSDTFDDDLFMTVAHSDDTNLHFYNVCGGIKFSLSRDDITAITFSGNNSEDIAGDITVSFVEGLPKVSVDRGEKTITVTPKGGGTFASDTYYYIVALPQTLSGGFTMTFETETQIGTFEYNAKAVTIKRSVFGKKDDIDGYAGFVSKPSRTNLSAAGTANCYIVPAAGDYKFNASVKGNSNESVGTPVSVDVLWETFGTSVAPSVGDLVYSVSLNEGYIHFSATNAKGNALIAVKDSEGTILWSWHIWLVNEVGDETYTNIYSEEVLPALMDRNLGATSKTVGSLGAYGLLYQWGRKDPFPGSSVLYTTGQSEESAAVSTRIESKRRDLIDGSATEFSIKNPNCFIWVNTYAYNDHWGAASDAWGISKTIYDPCPVGYKMPIGRGPSGGYSDPLPVWYYSGFVNNARYDSTNHGWLIETSNGTDAWYPLSGLFPSSGYSYYDMEGNPHKGCFYPGKTGKYWTGPYFLSGYYCTYGLSLRSSEASYEYNGNWASLSNIAEGGSVRCQKL